MKDRIKKNKIPFIIGLIIVILIIISLLLTRCKSIDKNIQNNNSNKVSNVNSNVNNIISNSNINSNSNSLMMNDENIKLEISEIKGIPNKWINSDVTIELISNRKDVVYSFDNGVTWQSSNKYVIKDNTNLHIISKTTDEKYIVNSNVTIDKIDKTKPVLNATVLSTTEKEIVIQLNASDTLSGNVQFSLNNGKYSKNNKFIITKVGKYTFYAKDSAGNVSNPMIFNITKDNFLKKDTNTQTPEIPITPEVPVLPEPPVIEEDEPVIEYKTFNVIFYPNGSSMANQTLSCITSTDSCVVTAPQIVRDGWEIIGWSKDKDSTSSDIKVNQELVITENNSKYYAITKKTLTATFNKIGTDDDGVITRKCDLFNYDTRCYMDIPTYNKTGAFNISWTDKPGGNPLNYYKAGTTTLVGSILEFYTSFKNPYYGSSEPLYQERDLSIVRSLTIGDSLYEYETGIPNDKIENHYKFMKEAYSKIPWLFVPGKNFVLTYETFDKISMAYAVTYHSGVYYFIDLKYDSKGDVVKNEIDDNATLHELAHAWDSYYGYRMNTSRISSQSDVTAFYNSLSKEKRNNLTKVEWFAGAVTEYYWHYLGMNTNKPSYAGFKSNYTEEEKAEFVKIIEKYINISKNGYKK